MKFILYYAALNFSSLFYSLSARLVQTLNTAAYPGVGYLSTDVLLNGHGILAEGELHSLCCMMGKTMSPRYQLLAANG